LSRIVTTLASAPANESSSPQAPPRRSPSTASDDLTPHDLGADYDRSRRGGAERWGLWAGAVSGRPAVHVGKCRWRRSAPIVSGRTAAKVEVT